MAENAAEDLAALSPGDRANAHINENGGITLRVNIFAGEEPEPSIDNAFLAKASAREEVAIKRQAESMGLAEADVDPLTEWEKTRKPEVVAAMGIGQAQPAAPEQEGQPVVQGQGGGTGEQPPQRQAAPEPQSEDDKPGIFTRAAQTMRSNGSAFMAGSWRSLGSVVESMDEMADLAHELVTTRLKSAGYTDADLERMGVSKVKMFENWLGWTDHYAKNFEKGVQVKDFWSTLYSALGQAPVGMLEFAYGGGWYPMRELIKSTHQSSMGLSPGESPTIGNQVTQNPVGAATIDAATGSLKWATNRIMNVGTDAFNVFGRVASQAGWGVVDAALDPARVNQGQVGTMDEMMTAAATQGLFGAFGGGKPEGWLDVRRLSAAEAAPFSENVAAAYEALRAGQTDAASYQVVKALAVRMPELDAQTQFRVSDEFLLAPVQIAEAAGLKVGQVGQIVGKATTGFEEGIFKAVVDLYSGHDAGTVVHEFGHRLLDQIGKAERGEIAVSVGGQDVTGDFVKAGQELRQAFENITKRPKTDSNYERAFREFVVDAYTGWFMKERAWEDPTPKDGVTPVFQKVREVLSSVFKKAGEIEGSKAPDSVEAAFRRTAGLEGAVEMADVDISVGANREASPDTLLSGSKEIAPSPSSTDENVAAQTKDGKIESSQVRPLFPEAQWENLRSWERVGNESRPWEIVEKADKAGEALVRANFSPVFGQLADKAVNINLSRLKTGEDIKAVIHQVGEALRPQMEEARRYVQTDSMVQQAAQEMVTGGLAGDLGMTESTLLQRQRGEAFNSEQAVAARMILVSSAGDLMRMAKEIKGGDNSDSTLLAFRARMETHAAIQAQVSGMTAEAGRALRSFRILAGESDLAPGVKLNQQDIQHIVEQVGGRGDILRMADTLAVLAETGENSITQVNKAINEARSKTWRDWVFGYRYASMLSGVPTHLRNITGNALVAAISIPERAVAHKLGVVSRFLGSNNPEHVELHEARAMAFGYLNAQVEALKLAAIAFKTRESQFGPQQVEQASRGPNVDNTSPLEKVADFAWEAIQLPTRVLGAEDEYFKAINYRAELGAQAYRTAAMEGLDGGALAVRAKELMNNPSEDMHRRSLDAAKARTFNSDLEGPMRDISRGLSASVVGKWFVPFLRTPYNIFKYSVARSPLALVTRGFHGDIRAGGARAELAIAQMVVGSTLMTLGGCLASQGIITGGGPSDPGERNVWLQNFQPYSVKIGDNWLSYGNAAEPISTFLSVSADFHAASTHWMRDWDNFGEVSVWELSTALTKAFSKNITDKTFLRGVADLVHLLDDPDRYAENILASGLGSLVPATVGNIATAMDPEMKMVGGVLDALLNRVPGAKSTLPPRRNLWGEPILSTESGPSVAWWSPIKIKGDHATEIDKEMLRLGMSVAMPRKEQGFSGIGVELTPEEYSRYMELAGQEVSMRFKGAQLTLKDYLNELIESPAYQRLVDKSDGPDGAAALTIKGVIQDFQESARRELLKETPRIQDLVSVGLAEKRRQGR